MPTNRTRRRRPRLETKPPGWALRLLKGECPERDSEDGHTYFGWLYFDDPVPGLPPADSAEGRALWYRATNAD